MKTIEFFKNLRLMALLFSAIAIIGCSDDDDAAPEEENELEVITNVTLTFTPDGGGTAVTATAEDPDGEGVDPLVVDGGITLATSTTYTLTFDIQNSLATDPEEADIGKEIKDEDFAHQFFFSFTDGAFADPTGNGNIDTASDDINYNDQDGNGDPLGLETTWTTSDTPTAGGNFTVRLQHQPGVKTSTTGAEDGETDFNLSFVLNVQ